MGMVPLMPDIYTIRCRHLADEEFRENGRFNSPAVGEQAHADRGDLLAEIERLERAAITPKK